MYSRNKRVDMIPDLLAKLIDEIKEKTGKNLTTIAEESGVGCASFYRIVNRESGIQPKNAVKLNQYFETTLFSPYQIRDGQLIYFENNYKTNRSANKFQVGQVVKNLFNKKLESIIKIKFNKDIQDWQYLLAGENEYIEEQFLKELKKPLMPPHKLKPEEPVVEKPVIVPTETPKEEITVEPKVELIKKIKEIENTTPTTITKDNKEELKSIILSVVEKLLCLL